MKHFILFSVVFLALAGCQAASGRNASVPEIRARKARSGIQVDGRLQEESWKDAQGINLRSADGKRDASRTTMVKLLYDERNLYMAFHCEDPDIWTDHRGRDSHMWTEDVVESFIDLNPGDPEYVELEVNPTGDLFDGFFFQHRRNVLMSWNPDIQVAVQVDGTTNKRDDTDRSWTVEMAIPVGDLTLSPGVGKPGVVIEPGMAWRINFYRNERSGEEHGELQAWAPVRGDFHAPALFGKVVFE